MKNSNAIISTIAKIHNNANKLIIEELKKHNLDGLAPSHGDILVLLYEKEEGVPMNKISASINKDKSTITALINKLLKMELIEKIKCEKDSRSSIIKLSKKGLKTKPIIKDTISTKLLDITYKGFSEKEKELVVNLLERIKQNFK